MANELEQDAPETGQQQVGRSSRPKPTKLLPTDRVGFDKQKMTLRGVAKASLQVDRGSVSNSDVARYVDMAATSVSHCNSFWIDAGLIVRDGQRIRPVDAVFEYDHAAEWTPDVAFHKLAPVLANTWFGRAMLTKLAIKPVTLTDAVAFLAQECNAPPEYKGQLMLLLDYLEAAGLVSRDGNMVHKVASRTDSNMSASPAPAAGGVTPAAPAPSPSPSPVAVPKPGMRRIVIALPTHADVTMEFPEALDADDWVMVADQLATYIKRWKRLPMTPGLAHATEEPDVYDGEKS